jgi:lipopolysaccharide export system permease protein
MLKILDRYILGKFLVTFFFTLLMIIIIAVVFDVSEKFDRIIESNPSTEGIIKYYLYFALKWSMVLSSFFTFISVIIFTSSMANRTEIVPILSGGISYKRLMRPYIVGASILTILSLMVMHFILPGASIEGLAFEKKNLWRTKNRTFRKIHIKQDDNTYLFFKSFSNNHFTGRQFSMEVFDGDALSKKVLAEGIIWNKDSSAWYLDEYHIRTIAKNGEETIEIGEKKKIDLSIEPQEVYRESNDAILLNYFEIKETIADEEARGSNRIQELKIEHYGRTAYSFSNIILTLIAFFIASKKVRGGIGLNISIGLFMIMVYLMLNRFFNTFAIYSDLSPVLAVWFPNILYSGVAYYFYKRAQK